MPLTGCCRVAPTASSDVSTVTDVGASGAGHASKVEDASAAFALSIACWVSSDQASEALRDFELQNSS